MYHIILLCSTARMHAPVQGSRQCNSSYAFAAVGAVEGAWALARGTLTRLSEQNIIDCSGENDVVAIQSIVPQGHSVFSGVVE